MHKNMKNKIVISIEILIAIVFVFSVSYSLIAREIPERELMNNEIIGSFNIKRVST